MTLMYDNVALKYEADLKLLAELTTEKFGISFSGNRMKILEGRLKNRLKELHMDTFGEYYRYIKYYDHNCDELKKLSQIITNNETYFFRESHQLEAVIDIINNIIKSGKIAYILSAACSSGEEPYSLAIYLLEKGLAPSSWKIDACDLHEGKLEQARRGVYRETSLRTCTIEQKEKYFIKSGDLYLLKDKYKQGVHFQNTNLADPTSDIGNETYDIIFCRNMLIYFEESAFDTAVSMFYRALKKNGFLLLGNSESLIGRRKDFIPTSLKGAVAYTKRIA